MKPSLNILLISNEPWGDLWYSKHHYAHELNQLGHTIYFINPAGRWHPGCVVNTEINISDLGHNFYTIDYHNPWPTLNRESCFRKWNDRSFAKRIREKLGVNADNWLIWHFDPYRLVDMPVIGKVKMILHIVDRYHGKLDIQLSARSELTVTVSKTYMERYASAARRILHIPHGISKEMHHPDPLKVSGIRAKFGPYYLYTGSFNSGVDFHLLLKLANEILSHNMLLLGPEPAGLSAQQSDIFQRLKACERVILPGVVNGAELGNYIKASELCIVPYRQDQQFRVQTLKAIQYLGQQKPVVSIPLVDLEPFEGESVFFAENHEVFIDKCHRILDGEMETDFKKSNEYCGRIAYPKLIGEIFNKLEE